MCAENLTHLAAIEIFLLSIRFDWVKWQERTNSNGKTRRRTERLRKTCMAVVYWKETPIVIIVSLSFILFFFSLFFHAMIHSNSRYQFNSKLWFQTKKEALFSIFVAMQNYRMRHMFKTIRAVRTYELYLQQLNEWNTRKRKLKRWHWARRYITSLWIFRFVFFSSSILSFVVNWIS